MTSRRWKRAKSHLVFYANTITQCGRKSKDIIKGSGLKEDITCRNCLRWMNSKKGKELGWGTKR
jgi:hypothetical protein